MNNRSIVHLPLSVLIVEDSQSDTMLLVRHLDHAGYDVVHERVETASEMQAALRKSVWDLVIADYSMPHFSAQDALRILQASGKKIPFFIVSGIASEEIGAADYLMKGNLARLVPAIERELASAKIRLEYERAQLEINCQKVK